MCLIVYRQYHCIEDSDRLPGENLPQPSSGKWPYEAGSDTAVNLWPVQGKNHTKLFIARCSHPSSPEVDHRLPQSDGPMCFSAINPADLPNGENIGTVTEWYDEPCPECNGLSMFPHVTQSPPVRTQDLGSFEPTDWSGVRSQEQCIVELYAKRLTELCAHALGSVFQNEEPNLDPYWDDSRKGNDASVSMRRLRIAVRELMCPVNVSHGPFNLPLLVYRTANPWSQLEGALFKDHASEGCKCRERYWSPDHYPPLNVALTARQLLAGMMMKALDRNCTTGRWSADKILMVVGAAQSVKDRIDELKPNKPLSFEQRLKAGGIPSHILTLRQSRPMAKATATARLDNLMSFANELRANTNLSQVGDAHRHTQWEILTARMLAYDSGLTLRRARMILWHIMTEYWRTVQMQNYNHQTLASLRITLAPSAQLAFLSQAMWSAKGYELEDRAPPQDVVSSWLRFFLREYFKFPLIRLGNAEHLLEAKRLCHRAGTLAGTVRAYPSVFRTLVAGDGAECGICREPLVEHDIKLPRQPLKCYKAEGGHWFGHACLAEWIDSCPPGGATCPVCRRAIRPAKWWQLPPAAAPGPEVEEEVVEGQVEQDDDEGPELVLDENGDAGTWDTNYILQQAFREAY